MRYGGAAARPNRFLRLTQRKNVKLPSAQLREVRQELPYDWRREKSNRDKHSLSGGIVL